MSRQLTISATLSTFAMAAFAVLGTAGTGPANDVASAAKTTTGAEISITAPVNFGQ